MYIIYRIWHIATGKSYVGQTKAKYYARRKSMHFTGKSKCPLLVNAVRKHGRDAFDMEILLDGLSESEVDNAEKEMIRKYNTLSPNGYNLQSGGNLSKTHHPETRERLSEIAKSIGFSGENNPFYGQTHTDETRQAMSDAQTRYCERLKAEGKPHHNEGKVPSPEKRRAISLGVKRYYAKKRENPLQLKLFEEETDE